MKQEEKKKYFIMLAQSAHAYVTTKNSSISEIVYYDMIYALKKLNYL